jgi:hypothetical protein
MGASTTSATSTSITSTTSATSTTSTTSANSIIGTTSTTTCLLTTREGRPQQRWHKGEVLATMSAGKEVLLRRRCRCRHRQTCYYTTSLSLWRDCHIQNLDETLFDLAIVIKFRCNLTCFRPVRSFDLLGGGSSPHSAINNYTLGGGPALTVLFATRAHQPTLWVDLRVDGLHQPTLNTQSANSTDFSFSGLGTMTRSTMHVFPFWLHPSSSRSDGYGFVFWFFLIESNGRTPSGPNFDPNPIYFSKTLKFMFILYFRASGPWRERPCMSSRSGCTPVHQDPGDMDPFLMVLYFTCFNPTANVGCPLLKSTVVAAIERQEQIHNYTYRIYAQIRIGRAYAVCFKVKHMISSSRRK